MLLPNASAELTTGDVGLQAPVTIDVPKGKKGEICGNDVQNFLFSQFSFGAAASVYL
jgi:hypothetical protein